MQKIARFFYCNGNASNFPGYTKECYILKTFDTKGMNEGIVAVFNFSEDGKWISYTALTEAIKLQNLGYKLDI